MKTKNPAPDRLRALKACETEIIRLMRLEQTPEVRSKIDGQQCLRADMCFRIFGHDMRSYIS